MGYNIIIGELTTHVVAEPGEQVSLSTWAEERRFDEAPADHVPTRYTNSRWPSYTGWSSFCDEVGLSDLFFGSNGLMAEHPGAVVLTREHLAIVEAVPDPEHGYTLDRLVWLRWWMRWALDNCKVPVIANS